MEEKIGRLAKWAEMGAANPFSMEIWPTNRCNLKCVMCGTWANRRKLEEMGVKYDPNEEKGSEVSAERLLKLIEEAKELDVEECLLTGGGEPFVRKELTIRMMKKIKDCGMLGNINTNGTLISEEDVEKILNIGWDMMMFSIDAPIAIDDNSIRGVKGTFEKVKNTLLNLKKYKEKICSEKPKIVFNTVLTNKIYDKLDKMVEFASEVGCENITFIPLITYDDSIKMLELSMGQKKILQSSVQEAIRLSKKLGIQTNLSSLQQNPTSEKMDERILKEVENSPKDLIHSPCFEPFLHFLVKGNGEATCCCMLENSPENIKEKSLEKIWYGDYFGALRKNIINKQILPECKNCVFSQFARNKEIRNTIKSNS